jgi:enamine deaminase RidA (YjgF/YER057c/UK114 family)
MVLVYRFSISKTRTSLCPFIDGQMLKFRSYVFKYFLSKKFKGRYGAGKSMPARAVVPTGPLHFGSKIEIEAAASQFLTH